MKSLYATFSCLCFLFSWPGPAQQATLLLATPAPSTREITFQEDTPALQRIAAAKQQIASDPKRAQAYNELAIAFLRRTRETADPKYLKDADAALAQGLKLDATDFQLQKTQVALMLSRHQFNEARELALALHRRMPDDVMTYGYIAEADIALGSYSEAETNAQWMMNMRPNNTPALLVGATLRALYGDVRGAIEFLNIAYSQTSPIEVEELAWIANQIATLQIDSGQNDAAAETLEQAEHLFPRYPYTMENLARVRMSQHRFKDAVQQWTNTAHVDFDPHVLYELAAAQAAAGQSQEAGATLANFERLASAPETATDNSKLDLILMYADSPATSPKALRLARQAIQARQDVWTLDAYAWALYTNGQYQQANVAIQRAIAVGIQSSQIFDHAGHIAQKLGLSVDATKYFQLSLQTDPHFVPGAVGHDDQQKTPHIESAPTGIYGDAPSQPSPDPGHITSTVDVGKTAIPVFAPVPEALLTPQPTVTAHAIRTAQGTVARNPKDASAYATLGAAYFQRARETGDISDYQLAEESLNKSLDLVSADF